MLGGIIGVTLHYLRFGPKQVDAEKHENGGATVSTSHVISSGRTAASRKASSSATRSASAFTIGWPRSLIFIA